LLAEGFQGSVYEACNRQGKCESVIKVSSLLNQDSVSEEATFAKEAEEIGVGPKLKLVTRCQNAATKKWSEFIVMQRLSGPLLQDALPYKEVDIEDALDLYYKLLKEKKIAQNDLKGSNLMFDKGRLYLIDYGIASTMRIQGWKNFYNHMIRIATLFFKTLLGQGGEYAYWFRSLDEKAEAWITVVEAINHWLTITFPRREAVEFEFEIYSTQNIDDLSSASPTFRTWWKQRAQ
jgi:predicted Ser/Thr protein kinase